jgi:uncharacterized membrane protein
MAALEHPFWAGSIGCNMQVYSSYCSMIFGRTLIAGRQPLCTRFAEAVHAQLTPQHRIYAGQVTLAWTLFFGAMAVTSHCFFS